MKLMKWFLPKWMIELSKQLNTQPSRCTADPIWQVRTVKHIPADKHRGASHWVLYDDDGEFYRSDIGGCPFEAIFDRFYLDLDLDDYQVMHIDMPEDLDILYSEIPELKDHYDIEYCYVQPVEEIISTHLTEGDANWFIKRKGHDYPGAYTYVESAYWSPQIKLLREWLMNLTK